MVLCWLAVCFDGIDTFMYGATIPPMTEDTNLDMSSSLAGDIGSYATFGMLIGALTVGMLTDVIGRRWGIISCTVVFSVFSAVCAIAPNAMIFGIGRTLAGVGLGGLLPTAISMVSEYSPGGSRNFSIGLLMSAHQVGGILASLLGIWLLPALGWRSMYWVGVLPLIVLVPLILKYMPESLAFLQAKGRHREAEETGRQLGVAMPEVSSSSATGSVGTSLVKLFTGRNIATTLFFWCASFGGLLLVYGLSNWLPSLMMSEGFALGSSLSFLLVVNLGGVFGMLTAGRLSDSLGPVRVAMIWFFVTALMLLLLSVKAPVIVTYTIIFVAGFFLFSSQTMVYAAVAHVFPTSMRATAIGWTTGMGRFGAVFGPWLGGQLFAAGLESWGFSVFAAFAVSSMIFLGFVALSTRANSGKAVDVRRNT